MVGEVCGERKQETSPSEVALGGGGEVQFGVPLIWRAVSDNKAPTCPSLLQQREYAPSADCHACASSSLSTDDDDALTPFP